MCWSPGLSQVLCILRLPESYYPQSTDEHLPRSLHISRVLLVAFVEGDSFSILDAPTQPHISGSANVFMDISSHSQPLGVLLGIRSPHRTPWALPHLIIRVGICVTKQCGGKTDSFFLQIQIVETATATNILGTILFK